LTAGRRRAGVQGVQRFVQDLDGAGRKCLILLLAWCLLIPGASAEERPTWPELAQGESAVWIDAGGAAYWLTERSPLADLAPFVLGVGYGYRIGRARLSWRVRLLASLGRRRARFVQGDLLSVERVYDVGRWRPYWRVALGFGLDLEGAVRALGKDGYFNDDNGAAGGLSLAHGWGLDAFVADSTFLRLEVSASVHGGAGRIGVLSSATLGAGRTF